MSLVVGRRVVADQGVGGRRDGCFQRDGFLDRGGSQGDGSPGDPRRGAGRGGCGTERWGDAFVAAPGERGCVCEPGRNGRSVGIVCAVPGRRVRVGVFPGHGGGSRMQNTGTGVVV